MTMGLLTNSARPSATHPWALDLDVEIGPDALAVTVDGVRRVAELLVRTPGVSQVVAEPHCGGRFVRVSLAVQADGLADAVERATAFLRSCAVEAGLGRIVLVAVSYAGHR